MKPKIFSITVAYLSLTERQVSPPGRGGVSITLFCINSVEKSILPPDLEVASRRPYSSPGAGRPQELPGVDVIKNLLSATVAATT
jgi:hypothetical protein